MKIEKIGEKKNVFLHRKEIKMLVTDYKSTPSRPELVSAIAAKTGADDKNLVLDKVDQQFGKSEAVCYIKIYESEDFKKKYEEEYMLKRGAKKEKTEEPKEVKEEVKEKPKEEKIEKTEEKPEEKKTEEVAK